ncbi:MAG TPA: AMP-binding protein [Micromonosporaceae bacterium]|nr:AMP-binding protein [Micromonosporaceae bacterium]
MSTAGRDDRAVHPARAAWRPTDQKATISAAPTLGAALVRWAADRPADPAFCIYDMAGGQTELTVGELCERAAVAAAGIAGHGVGPGDRVAVSLDTGVDLVTTLFGAALLGAVPVLIEPPMTEGRARVWGERVGGALRRIRPRLLVADEAARGFAEPVAGGVRLVAPPGAGSPSGGVAGLMDAPSVAVPELPDAPLAAVSEPPADPDGLAFLQLTSGTVGHAKVACLTHRALSANAAAIAARTPYLANDLMVSWLPLHHDMGLVGATLAPFLHRIPVVLLPPLAFLLRPERWLWAVHRFRGNLSPAPNFAYQLCALKAADAALDGLDLSSWRATYNGAEVVNEGTVRLWQQRFGRYGLRPESMRPAYGLAEVGVAATLTVPGAGCRVEHVDRDELAATGRVVPATPGAAQARPLVSVGPPLPGYDIAVRDDDGHPVPDRVQGRVMVRGPSMMTGYFEDPAATGTALVDGWLETGDLGFLADGELFVTGRAKDLLIVAGRNFQPYPAETAVAGVAGVRPGGVAVVGVPDPGRGTDAVVAVVESALATQPQRGAALSDAVARAVTDELGVRPHRVVVVRPGSLPRTSSGKLRRGRIADDLAAGRLTGYEAPPVASR